MDANVQKVFQELEDQELLSKLHGSRKELILHLIFALFKKESPQFTKLAKAIPSKAQLSSVVRRIQYFFSDFALSYVVVMDIMLYFLKPKNHLNISIDRTNWQFGSIHINILCAFASVPNGLSLPIYFTFLSKGRGNTNTLERTTLICHIQKRVDSDVRLHVLADREFIGDEWVSYLEENKVDYTIRVRNNTRIMFGESSVYPTDLIKTEGEIHAKKAMIWGKERYISVKKIEKKGKTSFISVISSQDRADSLELYKERWGIEAFFQATKGRGFNMEDTHLKDLKRLRKLFALICLAYLLGVIIGKYKDTHQKKNTYQKTRI